MSKLWHFHSSVLQGFYASEVFVCADTREEAIPLAVAAYDAWLAEQIDTYYYDPLTPGGFTDEPEYEAAAIEVRNNFVEEAREQLTLTDACLGDAMIFRRT